MGTAMVNGTHNERHQPEPTNNVLLIRLVMQLDVGKVMERNQVEHHG
jgi:hypothetical protein